jgi:3-hydroxy-9,10-secoandrosta-1,3,5(10)-triene-9,17-dione monooxygenase reductase component
METALTPPVAAQALRQAMRHWATGVTIVTARPEGHAPIGLVCNSFTSVSLEPPLVSWCVDRASTSFGAWMSADSFSVHILAEDDAALIPRFAARGADKFAGLAPDPTHLGTPALDAGAARLDCRVWRTYDGGDHAIVVGRVERIEERDGARPLDLRALRGA